MRGAALVAGAAVCLALLGVFALRALEGPQPLGQMRLEASDVGDMAGQILYRGEGSHLGCVSQTTLCYFDGGRIGFQAVVSWESSEVPTDKSMRVELHQVDGLLDRTVGVELVAANGEVSAAWEDLGAGEYYVRLVRTSELGVATCANAQFFGVLPAETH